MFYFLSVSFSFNGVTLAQMCQCTCSCRSREQRLLVPLRYAVHLRALRRRQCILIGPLAGWDADTRKYRISCDDLQIVREVSSALQGCEGLPPAVRMVGSTIASVLAGLRRYLFEDSG